MKQLLVIAIALTSVNAFATRARTLALGSSPHLIDTNTVYAKPYDMFRLGGDYVVLETGATGGLTQTAANSNAEGMIVRTMGDAKLGLSLGHQSQNASSWGLRGANTLAPAALKVNQQNPIEFSYGMKTGDIAWAGTLVYSNYNNKVATAGTLEKESSMGVRFGATSGAWDGALSLGLANTANIVSGNKFTGTSAIGLNGGYQMDTMYFFGNFVTAGAKEEDNAGTQAFKINNQTLSLGVVNSHKKDGNDLFYSVALNQGLTNTTTGAAAEVKTTTLSLPIVIGLEVEAASWMTLRGSVSQSTLINSSKTEQSGVSLAETDPGANTTTVALGAGLKFNKLTFDGTLSTATTQTVNTTNLLAQAGMTYWF